MTNNFPPRSTHEREIEALLNVLNSVVDGAAIYLSAPITSGRRFSAWYASRNGAAKLADPEAHEEFVREVVERNRAHAHQLAQQLRHACQETVIDPTAMKDVSGWTQDDYRDFWGRVIEKYASRVVLLDGWQYSNGCSYEFLTACRKGIPTFRENMQSINASEGARMIEAAIDETRANALSTLFLERVVAELHRLLPATAEELCTK